MTDEAKALGRAAAAIWVWVPIGEGRIEYVNACGKAADLIEAQAREIERLRGDLEVARKEAGSNYRVALAWERTARAALGESHDQ